MDEYISRKKVIELIRSRTYDLGLCLQKNLMINAVNNLPAADVRPVRKRTVTTMKDDTISRAAAVDAMMKLQTEDIETYGASIPEGFDGDRAAKALKALPPAQQWIPFSEETPVDGQLILTCDKMGIIYLMTYHDIFSFEGCAWMPLPGPWEGGQDGAV